MVHVAPKAYSILMTSHLSRLGQVTGGILKVFASALGKMGILDSVTSDLKTCSRGCLTIQLDPIY